MKQNNPIWLYRLYL